ncbi:potassium-transporting ATPase subunit KdpC [Comamonas terrae]|uniref:Potassium-transporting ATPase KdpC subunit n=1 Tax=Comamonas terrae TaxID=673548 RepID=A0ABW5URY1_9BURK|nr:potassium-transporting ATPase subunit KdpC [Comamonas terrae]
MKSSSLSISTPATLVADAEASPASWSRLAASSVRAAVAVMLVAGIAYPLATTGVAQALLPHTANGSLIERNGLVVGSALIGQQFAGPAYFHGRPSATTAPDPAKEGASVAAPYNAGQSGGSNQGATHKDLAETVAARVAQYREGNGLAADAPVPVDAVTASASGLDPHISVANAVLQLPRVARERNLSQEQVRHLVEQNTQGRTLGLLGEPRVNVLQLNLALDALQSAAKE